MEQDKSEGKYDFYDKLQKLAIYCVEFGDHKRAQEILGVMISIWPERVIAKGEIASDMDVSDSELDTPVTVPQVFLRLKGDVYN